MKYVFYGKIVGGKLELDHRELMTQLIKSLKDMDIEVEIRKQSDDPSLRQWAYLYGSVYKECANCWGWSINDVDLWMKKKFMRENGISLPDGLILTKTCFDKAWLAKYVDSCIMYAAQEGVVVMPPNIRERG